MESNNQQRYIRHSLQVFLCSFFFVILLLFTLPVKASEQMSIVQSVIAVNKQRCMRLRAGLDKGDMLKQLDEEESAAATMMLVEAQCDCLTNELENVDVDIIESLDSTSIKHLLSEKASRCVALSVRKHVGAFCRASKKMETDDQKKIEIACSCFESEFEKMSEDDILKIFQHAFAKYKGLVMGVETNGFVSQMEHCNKVAGIESDSEYRRQKLEKNER